MLAPAPVSQLGSYPEETLRPRYNSRGLPRHLEAYSLEVKREEHSRETNIDQRLPKDLNVKLTTSVKQKLTKIDLRT